MPHALPARVSDALARVFEERPIGTIAPSYGCILRDRDDSPADVCRRKENRHQDGNPKSKRKSPLIGLVV